MKAALETVFEKLGSFMHEVDIEIVDDTTITCNEEYERRNWYWLRMDAMRLYCARYFDESTDFWRTPVVKVALTHICHGSIQNMGCSRFLSIPFHPFQTNLLRDANGKTYAQAVWTKPITGDDNGKTAIPRLEFWKWLVRKLM